jgi:group I intron endonuclease
MLIYKAISKHGLSNFEFEILEYCGPDNIEVREQAYIDLLNPEYNLSPTAGSNLGYK